MHRRHLIALTLVMMSLGAKDASPPSPATERWRDAALDFVRSLETKGPSVSANQMLYPSILSAAERLQDQRSVAEALQLAITCFGSPSKAIAATKRVEFFEFSIGGGPRPYWWRDLRSASLDLAVLVQFSNYGPGVMRLSLVEDQAGIKVAAVGFGLFIESPHAEERISKATQALLDSLHVPPDHPARGAPIFPAHIDLPPVQ
jgi:hypothetical protein